MIWLVNDEGGRGDGPLEIEVRRFANEGGSPDGGDVDGNEGERGDSVRGKDGREIPNVSLVGGLRGELTSPPEDVRAKGLRAVLGGCSDSAG